MRLKAADVNELIQLGGKVPSRKVVDCLLGRYVCFINGFVGIFLLLINVAKNMFFFSITYLAFY